MAPKAIFCYTDAMPEEPHLSSVERAAARIDEGLVDILKHDTQKERQGFQMGRPEGASGIRVKTTGMPGKRFEQHCIKAHDSRKIPNVTAEDLPEIPNDNAAIAWALRQSSFAQETQSGPLYPDRELYISEWLGDVYHSVCDEMRSRGHYSTGTGQGIRMEDLVKPVPCLHNQMDLHRGIDCFFVFHDPASFIAASTTGFAEQNTPPTQHDATREARYWNPDTDTIVTIDVTAFLGAKFGNAARKGTELTADIFAAKVNSATNHYLRQQMALQGTALPEREEIQGGRLYWDRMHTLAQRIVDAFEAKSGILGGTKLRHIRNPEAERQEQIESVRTETKRAAEAALALRKRQEADKLRGKAEGEEHRAHTGERRAAGLEGMNEQERRIYEGRRADKQGSIDRAKKGKRKKRD